MAKHVFLSFIEEDKHLVELFRGQAKNQNLDLEFDDYSIKESINSEDEEYIRGKITEKIEKSSIILCLISHSTHTHKWVKWELEKGYELDKCLIGVRLHSDSKDILPSPLNDYSSKVIDWKIDDIVDAINNCDSKS